MKFQFNRILRHQAGVTLMELMMSLAIAALVVVGALSLYSGTSSTNTSTQLMKDIMGLRSATQQFFMGQGSYGTASLNQALITANKVPGTMTVSGTSILTANGGQVTVTGATTNFTISVTNVDASVCSTVLANTSTGWSSVTVNGGSAITAFPISPLVSTSANACGGTAPFTITWTSNG